LGFKAHGSIHGKLIIDVQPHLSQTLTNSETPVREKAYKLCALGVESTVTMPGHPPAIKLDVITHFLSNLSPGSTSAQLVPVDAAVKAVKVVVPRS